MGPAFPYGTLIHQRLGEHCVGFFHDLGATERALVDPRWRRLLVVVGFMRSLYHFFRLRLRDTWPFSSKDNGC